MRINKAPLTEEMKKEITQKLATAPEGQEAEVMAEVMEQIVAAQYGEYEETFLQEVRRAEADADYKKQLGLRAVFTEEEKKFYQFLKGGAKQAVTVSQIDVIPTTIVDRTLAAVREASGITSLIKFPPATVQKWLFGAKTGAAVWGNLTAAITGEISATISSANMDIYKLTAYCLIPKSIRELEIGYVDKYFSAVLTEAMEDGIAAGYLNGDGKTAPIGIMRQIGSVESDGTHTAKTAVTTVTDFSPAGLAPVLVTLSNNGTRKIKELAVIAHPNTVYTYINPSLYADSVVAGYAQKAPLPVKVYEDVNVTQGKAVFTVPGAYTMGFGGIKVNEYKETKALDDVDTIIAKAYANGRADDDNAAVVIDATQLTEYKLPKHKT